jgi:hypothetical protein
VSGCSSPELLAGVTPKLIAAPFLTYVDGDPAAGTTTILSAPLLTYHGARVAPGLEESTTCVVPLLAHSSSAVREIRVVRKEPAPGCPDDEGWWADRDPLSPKLSARERRAAKQRQAKAKKRGVSLSRPRRRRTRRPRRKTEVLSATEGDATKNLSFERVGAKDLRRWEGYTLGLDPDAQVTQHKYPATSTEVSILWPLVRLKRDQPGRVGVRQRGVTRVYEVGPQRTEFRVLPLFSHTSTFDTSQTIIWPLLGFGWETTPQGTYVRLFYFLRFKVD